MNEIVENLSKLPLFIAIASILYTVYYSYKVRNYIDLIKDKLYKELGTHYHYFSNPLMIPIYLLKDCYDEDIKHLCFIVKRLRIYLCFSAVLMILVATFIK